MKKTELKNIIKESIKEILKDNDLKKFDADVVKYINQEKKETERYVYRAKILHGHETVIKERPDGTPVDKLIIYDDLSVAKEVATILNINAAMNAGLKQKKA